MALLLVGLAAIVWSTKVVLDNAASIAQHYRVSDFFIGVLVLAVGSDLPELVVSIDAALRQLAGGDTASLIVGNAIGSCFGQMGLVIGLAGLIGRLTLERSQTLNHGAVLVGATLLLMGIGLDGGVSRLEGAALVLVFAAYIVFVLKEERSRRRGAKRPEASGGRVPGYWVRLLVGLLAVMVSAELIVGSAINLALEWGVDQSYIGIAIIGVGTSLPEVVISVAAVARRRVGLSVGNLIGSNVLDTLLPIGIAAVIVPVAFPGSILGFDLPVLLGLTLLTLTFLYVSRGVRWPQAATVLGIYVWYMVTISRAL